MQLQVLLVAGTHGNEINGIFLFDQWEKSPLLINTHGIKTFKVIGNPEAKKAGKRYIHQDLNRSFHEESFLAINSSSLESIRGIPQRIFPTGLCPHLGHFFGLLFRSIRFIYKQL